MSDILHATLSDPVRSSRMVRDDGIDGFDDVGTATAVGDTIRDHSIRLKDQATDKLRSFADEGKHQVTSSLDGLVIAAREIADKLQDGSFGPIGGYAGVAADTLERWKAAVDDKSIEDLIADGRDLARAQPALAVGLAVVAGFVVARFLKASSGQAV